MRFMTKRRLFLHIIAYIFIIFGLTTCKTGREKRSLQEKVECFISQSTTVATFGKVKVDPILSLSQYEQVPLLSALVNGSLNPFRVALNLDKPIYYTAQEKKSDTELVSENYVFVEVKNKDSLQAVLTKKGFQFEDTLTLSYVENERFHLVFDEYVAVIVPQNESKGLNIETFVDVFEKMNNGVGKNAEIRDILNQKENFIMGFHVANLYRSATNVLTAETKERQVALEQLLENNFIETAFSFEKGRLVVKIKNHFSNNVREKLFFNAPNSQKTLQYVACADPILGLSANVDTRKILELLEEYLPNNLEKWNDEINLPFPLTRLLKTLNGQIALMSCNTALLDTKIFVGADNSAKQLLSSFGWILGFIFEDIKMVEDGILFNAQAEGKNKTPVKQSLNSKLGTKTFDVFMDVSRINELNKQQYWSEINSIEVHYDGKGGGIIVETKNKEDNFLKQTLQESLKQFIF